MSVHNLDALFNPRSVALIGATNRALSVGQVTMKNLLTGGFEGPVFPVNPKADAVHAVPAFRTIADLPIAPDLAVVCVPPKSVPQTLRDLIARGVRAAIVLTAGLELERNDKGQTLQQEMVDIARAGGLRILGPNCVGLLVPPIGLNASFAHRQALPGGLAFVSQSGALCTGIIDWACSNSVGFSHFISIGNAVETDIGDILEYLADCEQTKAILLYIESITDARKFIAAARKASLKKPIIAIKSGSSDFGAKAAASHTGALAGADNVYEAALARGGILRVKTMDELLEATATLSGPLLSRAGNANERLAILTNGGGAGVLAVDTLGFLNGKMAELSQTTIDKLNKVLPVTWSHGNPVDIIGDAPVERYDEAFKILLDAPEVDSLLVLHCPIAVVSAMAVAQSLVKIYKDCGTQKSVSTCWIGTEMVAAARRIFSQNGMPTYETPEKAVRGIMHLVNFRKNRALQAMQDEPHSSSFAPDTVKARAIIKESLAKGVSMLNEHDAKSVLKAYGIPVAETRIVATPEDAARAAVEIGFPVVLKILSKDISHKSDAGGVILNLKSEVEVREAAMKMLVHIRNTMPSANLEGFTVQNMIVRPTANELIVGISTDRVFGPVILFGHGGVSVEVVKDSAVTLVPVNRPLARELVNRTRVSKLLAGYRDRPAADMEKIVDTLCAISQLVTDIPEIAELDINPLLADDKGVVALDGRIRVHGA